MPVNVIRSVGSIVSLTRSISSSGLTKTVRIATAPRLSAAPIVIVRNQVLPNSGALPMWGGIGGSISNQVDLQAALDAKAGAAHAHVIADVTGLQTALDNSASAGAIAAAVAAHEALPDPHPQYLTLAEAGTLRYEHAQAAPLAVWTINHNFGYRPDITVFSAGGMEVAAEILHTSSSQATATFDIPFSGMAICE
jgi:hypothetical protein